MTFNPSKCKVMHHLNDKPLESVTHISDLGVIVSKDLSWANHIEDICTKANKTLGLIKRVCARDVVDANTRKLLYCAVVRPKLEGVEYQLEFSFCFLLLSHHSLVIVIVISLCKCISFMCVTK